MDFSEEVDRLHSLVWREVKVILSELFFSAVIKSSHFLTNRMIA